MLPKWRDEVFNKINSILPMTEEDKAITTNAIYEIYEQAKMGKPKIVFVKSPFVARFAAGLYAALKYKENTAAANVAAADAAAAAVATADAADAAASDAASVKKSTIEKETFLFGSIQSRINLECKDECELFHEEHHCIKIEPGIYRKQIVVEYDHLLEESSQVID